MLRSTLPLALLALVLLAPATASAQGLLLPEGETGSALLGGLVLDEGITDYSVGLVVTPAPFLDLSIAYGQSDLGNSKPITLGASATAYLDHEGPSRAGAFVAAQRVGFEARDVYVFSVGAQAGRQTPVASSLLVVPTLSVGASLVTGSRDDGIQASVGGALPLVVDGGSVRLHVGPTVTLSSEVKTLFLGVQGGVLLF